MDARTPRKTLFSPTWIMFAMVVLCAAMFRRTPLPEIGQSEMQCAAGEAVSLYASDSVTERGISLLTVTDRDVKRQGQLPLCRGKTPLFNAFSHTSGLCPLAHDAFFPHPPSLQTVQASLLEYMQFRPLPSWRGLISFSLPPPQA